MNERIEKNTCRERSLKALSKPSAKGLRKALPFQAMAILWFLFLALALPPNTAAKEDTAVLTFKKLIPAEAIGKSYTVSPGDNLYTIIRNRLGARTPQERREAMEMIKKLNPHITDPSKIYIGQAIILPEPQVSTVRDTFGVEVVFYKVKRGDSLERILMSQLNVRRSNMSQMIDNVMEMNPRLRNPDHIVVNQVLRLPRPGGLEAPPEGSYLTGVPPEAEEADADPERPIIVPESLLRDLLIAGDVIRRLDGAMATDGRYFLPLAQYGQVTIDCASIPMVEFDDGSIVFVELKSRLPQRVKKIVAETWPNYRFVTVHEKDTVVTILQKIINASGSYRMQQGGRYSAGEKPSVTVSPEWSIHQGETARGDAGTFRRGLMFYRKAEQALPSFLKAALARRGINLTEVVLDSGVIDDKDEGLAPEAAPNLTGSFKVDLIVNLLNRLGEKAVKDEELNLFDRRKRGFNLTMRADIVLKRDREPVIFSFVRIPREFQEMLGQEGYTIVMLSDSDSRLRLITKVLSHLKIDHTFNYFRLTANHADKPGTPFITAIYPALQVQREGKFLHYLVDFPFDPVFYSYFRQLRGVSILEF